MILANNGAGLYKFRRELLEALLPEHEVCVCLPEDAYVDRLREMGCAYIACSFDRRGTNPVSGIKLLLFYKRILKKERPDVVFTYTIKPNVYGGMACAAFGIPYVVNITGLGTAVENGGVMQRVTLALYRTGLKKAKKIFFQNESNLEFIRERIPIEGRFELLPGSGVNLDEHCYEEYPEDDGAIRFLFVGRIMRDKGIEEYLDCAEALCGKYDGLCFDMIGDYDEDIYKDRIDRLTKEGIVTYYGFQKDVHSFLKSHHATIHPSYHEGLSNVLLETAACGRPILAGDIPGCRETFADGISGLAFEVRNAASLTDAVERFIRLPYEAKARMGLEGRKLVERKFDRRIVVDKYMKEASEKNIIFFIATLSAGGAERVVSLLANKMAEENMAVTIILYYDRKPFYELDARVKLVYLNREAGSGNVLKNVRRLRSYMESGATVVSFLAKFNILALIAAWGKNCRMVVADRSNPYKVPESKALRKLRDFLYHRSDGIVVQSRYNKNYFSGSLQKKTVIIHNPLELGDLAGAALRAEKRHEIITVGRLIPVKCHRMLIDAMKKIHVLYADYKLIIYGEGEMREELENYVKRKGLEDTVKLPGAFRDIYQRMLSAEMFVLCSEYEGMPNALMEAMGLGLPVISTRVSGAADMITDGKNGQLIDVNDCDALIAAMIRFIEDVEYRDRCAKAAADLTQRLDINKIYREWKKVIFSGKNGEQNNG